MLLRMDHFTIVTDKLRETTNFYTLLGMIDGPRPKFGLPGSWLYLDGHPVLHIIETDAMPEPRRGALDHMAYFGTDFVETAALLCANGISYRVIRAPRPYSTWQMFFYDPNGVEVEIDFSSNEVPPSDWKEFTEPLR